MRFERLIMIVLIVAANTSCNKETVEYDPEEVIVTINTTVWNYQYPYERVFVVVENMQSDPIFVEITKGENSIIKRGEEIAGDLINLHFVHAWSIYDFSDWRIISYYDILPGKEIDLLGIYDASGMGDGKELSGKGIVNISFSDVPEFDIATRSANNNRHCHTLNTLEVPCAPIGGNSYPSGYNFYVCLQKGDNAGYKLEKIPELSDYVISLNGLNQEMEKYSIPKNPDYQKDISISTYGSDGILQIFNMYYTDESLFTGDYIDVFVPKGLPQMTRFSTEISRINTDRIQSSYYMSDQVTTNNSFLDAGLTLSFTSGKFPVITQTSNEFDVLTTEISVKDADSWRHWTIYSPGSRNLYSPEFPSEVLQAVAGGFQVGWLLSNISRISVTATNDSRFSNYDDAVEFALKIRDFSEVHFSILSDKVWINK